MSPHLTSSRNLLAGVHRPRLAIPASHVAAVVGLWICLFFAALFTPPLLDDADATHAQVARAIVATADWVTLHVDGVRYLEKPPLPYWLVAISFRIFGFNTFATHLPGALAVLALATLGYHWARRSFGQRTALYTALATLTCTGVFLFTRVFIPEVLLSLLLCITLYTFRPCLAAKGSATDPQSAAPAKLAVPYILWISLALAVLTKGFVALIFFFGTAAVYLALTRKFSKWRLLRPLTGVALFLLIAAPWHILASLRNTGGVAGHGFAWFYFINEHVFRFLGRRTPRDYNKLPAALYWLLHLVWLFPWSLFAPVAGVFAWRKRRALRLHKHSSAASEDALLLAIFSFVVMVFFSFSTNQEYYTFPAYLPLLMLIMAAVSVTERSFSEDKTLRRTLLAAHIAFTVVGAAVALALAYGLFVSRHYPYVADIGALLAHRGVGSYTLAMSSFFDLTGPSFAALRLPAALAMFSLAIGPATAWFFRAQRRHLAATATVALTSAAFLIAAHIALARFAPMLSSKAFADRIFSLSQSGAIDPDAQVMIFGDQAFGSSIVFYLDRPVTLVDGRTTSMYFGSTFPDAPPVFISSAQLRSGWGRDQRKLLFVPIDHRGQVSALLPNAFVIAEESGKILLTDRALTTHSRTNQAR